MMFVNGVSDDGKGQHASDRNSRFTIGVTFGLFVTCLLAKGSQSFCPECTFGSKTARYHGQSLKHRIANVGFVPLKIRNGLDKSSPASSLKVADKIRLTALVPANTSTENDGKDYTEVPAARAEGSSNFTESTLRSVVKSLLWRMIAGTITFVTSYRFSNGSMKTAFSIVGSDFFSKVLTMFIGERIMNKSQAGRKLGSDNAKRSLIKALIWRLFAILNTLTMAVFISKDLSVASKIAGSDALFKTALMFVYERAWANIKWGKDYAEGMVRQQQNETEQEKPLNGACNHRKLFRVVLAVRRRYKLWKATAAV